MKRLALTIALIFTIYLFSQNPKKPFQLMDVFDLEYAANPKISPNGEQIVYNRKGFDMMSDRLIGRLWVMNSDGTGHRKLTSREANESQASWSPLGDRIAFVSSTNNGSEIYMYWVNSGQIAKLSQLPSSPSSLTWSPNGKFLFFSMKVEAKPPVLAKIPTAPKGAKWAKKARITDRLKHEADGKGYIKPGFSHIFKIPADGGTAKQITNGKFNHSGSISITPNGKYIYFSANRNKDWEYDFINSEVYKVNTLTKKITQITNQKGPNYNPKVSPNGKKIAFISYKDKVQAYQTKKLFIADADGKNRKLISGNLDRSVKNIIWDSSGTGLYFMYDNKGNTKIAHILLNGKVKNIVSNVGGTTLGRPYGSGSYSVSKNGTIVFTKTRPEHPSELAVAKPNKKPVLITQLNNDILDYRQLGKTEELWYNSSVDGRKIQGWIVKPPNYDASKKYPLLVEIHGGPILNYGDRFTAEIQLYAANGYLVFYPNPRGSTSYGEEFGNLLYNNYPGEDYNDVMDGVDHLVKKGIADNNKLFVTGGSAGGIMTTWIIGKNNRFKAAVVVKPVINWISKTLVADNYYRYANYRYPNQPWENFKTYWKFSPISLVGNIETPTMVMVGMEDLRTPTSEAKQLYHALKLRKIPTVLVEFPGAYHNIAKRPSQMISKVAHILAWIKKYK